MQMIEEGKLQPWKVTSHRLPLLEAAMGYEKFDAKEFNKVETNTRVSLHCLSACRLHLPVTNLVNAVIIHT
jgi:predicted phage-related endonuclease